MYGSPATKMYGWQRLRLAETKQTLEELGARGEVTQGGIEAKPARRVTDLALLVVDAPDLHSARGERAGNRQARGRDGEHYCGIQSDVVRHGGGA
jgi:hypothetical protein